MQMYTLDFFKGLVVSLFLSVPALSQRLISSKTDSLIKQGIHFTIVHSYQKAYNIFTSLQYEMPKNPVGYFFHAAALQSEMMDFERYDDEPEFLFLIKKTIELSNTYLKRNSKAPWGYFFLGGGYAYLAFYQGKQAKYFDSFRNGAKSVHALERALKADSTLYDVYFGLGTYKYFRSKLSRHFSWLPFVGRDREEGVAMIKKAIKKSRYSQFSAINGFFWIALEEERFEEARHVLQPALNQFPESRVFLWCAAKLAVKAERWQESVKYFRKILTSFDGGTPISPYNELVCRENLYKSYLQLGEYESAQVECKRISEISLAKKASKSHRRALKEARSRCQKEYPVQIGAGHQ